MSTCPSCGHIERKPQRCPLGCLGLLGNGIPVTSDQEGERGAIADLCNHMMEVHGAGSRDAWSFAEQRYPRTTREMSREAYEREGLPVPARYV